MHMRGKCAIGWTTQTAIRHGDCGGELPWQSNNSELVAGITTHRYLSTSTLVQTRRILSRLFAEVSSAKPRHKGYIHLLWPENLRHRSLVATDDGSEQPGGVASRANPTGGLPKAVSLHAHRQIQTLPAAQWQIPSLDLSVPEAMLGWVVDNANSISSLAVIGFSWGAISHVLLTG